MTGQLFNGCIHNYVDDLIVLHTTQHTVGQILNTVTGREPQLVALELITSCFANRTRDYAARYYTVHHQGAWATIL